MIDKIQSVRFDNFRGIPSSVFKLSGKSLLVLGSNGKGKSSIVDGIEFVFSGRVSRFTGSGTGRINHNDAVQHIHKRGTPKVSLSLMPSNGSIIRSLDSDQLETDRPKTNLWFDQHPKVDGFILRRARILDFINDQDADRYQKFVQLLGLSHVDSLQRCFVDAEKQAKDGVQRAQVALRTKLAVFRDPIAEFEPQSLSQILTRISDVIHSIGLDRLEEWSDVTPTLHELKTRRPVENKGTIDSLTKALVSLETHVPPSIEADVGMINELKAKSVEIGAFLEDAPKSAIITEALAYLHEHITEINCPLCERQFDKPLGEVLSSLGRRSEALRELREAEAKRRTAFLRVQAYAEGISALLARDLEQKDVLDKSEAQSLRNARALSLRWSRSLKSFALRGESSILAIPAGLTDLVTIRATYAAKLKAVKESLVPPDSSKLEAAIVFLEKGIAYHKEIESAEYASDRAMELSRRASAVNSAFSRARESSIQNVFEHIATTVLDYYSKLHNFESPDALSECTAIEIKPTSRSATGGLRLAIQFLGLADSSDPRAYLSEGHLDSLGLSLFLATVRIFNPPGSLLVLDDVLTSIDKEHRRRVGELLLQEFSEYQIVLTTHDEHWHELLSSSIRAQGAQARWSNVKIESWSVDAGPILSELEGSWEFIDAHLTEASYRELGGPFRLVLEDFLKRTASKLELKVRFNFDAKYTTGDFLTAGIQDTIRRKLIQLIPNEEISINIEIVRVFGQGNLINDLSHHNSGRLDITFDQAKDFVSGLRDLTKRCENNKIIKGV